MDASESQRALDALAWKHIEAEECDQAEVVIRRLLDLADPEDPGRLWNLFGLLASVLNSLARPGEATEMLRRALSEARREDPSGSPVGVARFMLANQLLVHGDPRDALAEASPIPAGSGHSECLLHSVAAQALWKLGRLDEATAAARMSIDASPTEDRRSTLTHELAHILDAG
jgi:Flp pilus assembly protein TadD